RLWAVENGLCFGRIDVAAGDRDGADGARGPAAAAGAAAGDAGDGGAAAPVRSLYIGRIGLSDDEQRRLLIDWRAPAAQPFYRATPAAPMGVRRRRHLRTKGRRVVGVDDD